MSRRCVSSSSTDFGEPSTALTILESSCIRLFGHSVDAGRGSWLILHYKDCLEVRSQTRLCPGTPNLQIRPSSPLDYGMTASRQPIEGPKLGLDGIDTVRPFDLSDKNSHPRKVILIAKRK